MSHELRVRQVQWVTNFAYAKSNGHELYACNPYVYARMAWETIQIQLIKLNESRTPLMTSQIVIKSTCVIYLCTNTGTHDDVRDNLITVEQVK